MSSYLGDNYVIILGSPRSGTTILAETLSTHPDVAYFYEPYYVWDYYHGSGEDDARGPESCSQETLEFIRHEMGLFAKALGKRVIVEQSPEESLKLPLIRAALPNARFIHLVRDGYDAIASIMREWEKRSQLVSRKSPLELAGKVRATLARQPYWHFRWMLLRFELKESGLLRPWRWMNKSKWQGQPGWGVRIPGWQDILANEGQLALNARQWSEAVGWVRSELAGEPVTKVRELRYEAFVTDPGKELGALARWMNIDAAGLNVGHISPRSIGRGRNNFSGEDVARINRIIAPLMKELGYTLMDVEAPTTCGN